MNRSRDGKAVMILRTIYSNVINSIFELTTFFFSYEYLSTIKTFLKGNFCSLLSLKTWHEYHDQLETFLWYCISLLPNVLWRWANFFLWEWIKNLSLTLKSKDSLKVFSLFSRQEILALRSSLRGFITRMSKLSA